MGTNLWMVMAIILGLFLQELSSVNNDSKLRLIDHIHYKMPDELLNEDASCAIEYFSHTHTLFDTTTLQTSAALSAEILLAILAQ